MIEVTATLIGGTIVGYTAQRARMCFVAGVRDWLLVRDSELLRGMFSFVLTVWLAFAALSRFGRVSVRPLGGSTRVIEDLSLSRTWSSLRDLVRDHPQLVVAVTLAAFVVGFGSILADGCPLRQHVCCARGDSRAALYLLGFYCGILAGGPVVVIITRRFG